MNAPQQPGFTPDQVPVEVPLEDWNPAPTGSSFPTATVLLVVGIIVFVGLIGYQAYILLEQATITTTQAAPGPTLE